MSETKEKYGFIYIWYDSAKSKLHIDQHIKRFYIGCHWGTEDDGYICSSNWMRDAYRRRPNDFKRRILSRIYTSKKDLSEEEYKWLLLIKEEELGKRYYNLRNHNFNHYESCTHSEESKEKNRQANSGKHHSPDTEFKKGQVPWNKGKEYPQARERMLLDNPMKNVYTIEKMRQSIKGRIPWNKGKKLSEEHKEKMSKAFKGKKTGPRSEETKEKIRQTLLRRNKK